MLRRLVFLLLFALPASALTPPPFERVLVPLSVPAIEGANGSRWTTELWVVNATNEPLALAKLPCLVSSTPYISCAPDLVVPPNRSALVPPLGTAAAPGVLLRVAAVASPRASFTLCARDLSRQSESWGVEVPVVRERDLFTGVLNLTAIPFAHEYRQTLRIYALLDQRESVQYRVKLYGIGTTADVVLREEVVTLRRGPEVPPNMIGTPLAQLAVTDLFAIESNRTDRVRVSVEPVTDPLALVAPTPFWAFVSVTNNVTQQVTTVTPR